MDLSWFLAFVSVVPQTVTTYRVASEESRFEVEVGRAGLFKLLGHDHRIRVGAFTGAVEWDSQAPESSRFTLEVNAASLTVAGFLCPSYCWCAPWSGRRTIRNQLGGLPAEALAKAGGSKSSVRLHSFFTL